MSSIIEMSELVLENIIGFLDFRAVYTLRQVCRDFRNFVDNLKKSKLPDSKFKKIHVFLKNEEMIRLTFIWGFGSQIEIERYFDKEKPGFIDLISQGMCLKYFENNKNYSKKEDLEMDRILEDLKFVLKSQKSILQDLTFTFNSSQDSITFHKMRNILKSLNQNFQTKRLRISGAQELQFLTILSLIDSKILEGIRILPVNPLLDFAINSEMDQVFETEQWKNSKEIFFGFSATNQNVEHFRHFSTSNLHFESISMDLLNVLKEFYINSPNFELSHLTVKHLEDPESLSTAWGAPFEFQYSRFWYFRMKNSKILKIRHRCVVFSVPIWFTCIEIGNVPQGAIIQD
ncbi:unnamed protein product [Caenorhabditis nigoni]